MKNPSKRKPSSVETVVRIGISSCLLGEEVRFDGGHKRDSLITDVLGRFVEFVPVCPEMEIGLGTPRETLRLVGSVESPRLIAAKSESDHTASMKRWAEGRLEELGRLDLHGYILKKDSPSCGMERVRVYGSSGIPKRKGRGLFAAALLERFPLLPVEEEGRLRDINLRENFVERVYSYHRWTEFVKSGPRARDLVRFHTQHKLTLSCHSDAHYRKLGRLVARCGSMKMSGILTEYGRVFMESLGMPATTRKHANVLYHILGYLKKEIDAKDKEELVQSIESYRRRLIPLIAPLTLLKHHLRRHPVDWVDEQTYLNPYPAELMLRNHV